MDYGRFQKIEIYLFGWLFGMMGGGGGKKAVFMDSGSCISSIILYLFVIIL
jgi:hypothetical protein